MPPRREPNPPLFLHVQADCPCCGEEIALMYRSVGHLIEVEVKHWRQIEHQAGKENESGTSTDSPLKAR